MNIKEKELTGISGTDEPDDPKIELPFTFGDDEDEDLSQFHFSTFSALRQKYSNAMFVGGYTYDQLIEVISQDYIDGIRDIDMNKSEISYELLRIMNQAIPVYNTLGVGPREKTMKHLHPMQVGMLMIERDNVVKISISDSTDPEALKLAIYQSSGPNKGIYEFDSKNNIAIKKAISEYNRIADKRYTNEVIEYLLNNAPIVERNYEPNLIPVNNGIYDYENKGLLPFSPDFVFISKSPVNYNPMASNVFITNDDGTTWDVDSWINEFSDDPEIVDVIWQSIAACLRPRVKWDKAILYYSRAGNNGKGTLCELITSLVGDKACAMISLPDLDKNFVPQTLFTASVIIGHENPVGYVIDKSTIFKSAVTHDPAQADVKHIDAKTFRFRGVIVQCLNDYFRVKDKTDSLARRLLIIPFEKSFTGCENKRIREEFLKRKDVLEYIMYRTLNMQFSELSCPQACIDALGVQRECNDPIRQFWSELRDEFKWEILPAEFLHDLYKAWLTRNYPKEISPGKNVLMINLRDIIKKDDVWESTYGQVRVDATMRSTSEPLIAAYDLKDWMNPDYTGHDLDRICVPKFKDRYTGLRRK